MMRISPVLTRLLVTVLVVSVLALPATLRPEAAHANAPAGTAVSGTAPFINTWLLAGALDASVVADPAVDAKEGDSIGNRTWEYFDDRLYNRNLDDYQDLYGHFKVKKQQTISNNQVAYAQVYVYSPSAKTAEFRTGSSGTHQVWVNGASVGSTSTSVEVNKDKSKYAITLVAGWNRILVKQVKTAAAYYWGFYGRISDANGDAIAGLEYSTTAGGSLGIATKASAIVPNDMPTAYTEWPYVWTKSNRGTEDWRPQASKFRFYGQGGTPGYTWSLASGSLPAGLTLAADGTIDGKVTASVGTYTFGVRVTDSTSATATKSFTIVVKERPNAWIQRAGQVALITAGASYTAHFDPNYSVDLWAERMKDQGIEGVYFEAAQQTSVWWPSVHQIQPTDDYITPYMEAVKRHGIRWGMYYPSEGGGNKHFSSNGFIKDVEDLILDYGNPSQWFFDGAPLARGNLDAMYSIIRVYGDEAVILSNDLPEQGDTDLKVTENARYWTNALGDSAPWNAPDNKVTFIDSWRHPFTKTFGAAWTGYHGGQVRDDWRNFAKAHIVEIATGQIADFDQLVVMTRGPLGSGTNPQSPLGVFPVDAQNFIDMREAYADWINPKLESLIGVLPGPLTAAGWGFSTQRDNLIYMHVLDAPAPINKTGMPAGNTITVSPVADTVTKVSVLNDGTELDFSQSGSTLTITKTGVNIDPIDTILKIETDKSHTPFPLTSIEARGTKTGTSTAKVEVEGYLNEYVGLKADLQSVTYASSNGGVATVNSAGVVTAVGQGNATITATAVLNGVSKSDSIDVRVSAGNTIRVTDAMIGAVIRLGGKETYFGKLYHQGSSAPLTIQGRGARGGEMDITGATITYQTDRPDLVSISSSGSVTPRTTVITAQRVAIWATVTLDGTTVTTNKVTLDLTDERIVSVNKPATSSSSASGFGAAKANDGVAYPSDGSDSSKWSAGSANGAWWQVDLGSKQNVSTLDVYFNHRNDAYKNVPKSVTYQVSDNGTTWTTVLPKHVAPSPSVEGGPSSIEPAVQVALNTSGRYVRLLFEDGATSSGIDLLEVAVWSEDTTTTVSASSQYNSSYAPGNAVDNIIGIDNGGEWASLSEANPWIELEWSAPVTINNVVLYDRVNPGANVNSGVLTFSDGSSVTVDGIPANGTARSVSFPTKKVEWMKFQATGGTGTNNGLSEIQVNRLPVPPVTNVAPASTATASSQFDASYAPGKAIDNVIGVNASGEWASNQLNPWIKLQWPSGVAVDKIVLHDRVLPVANVNSGTLTFSDGTSINVTGIDGAGGAKEVTFPEKTITWVQFTATGGTGSNNGLSEFQVYSSSSGKPTDYEAMWGLNGNPSDNSVNDLDATLGGSAGYSTTAPKEGGSSLSLDGSSGAQAAADLVSTRRDDITLSAWVKRTGTTSTHQMILTNGNSASNGYALFLNHGDSDRISILCGGVGVAASQVTLAAGQWTHVAATRMNGVWELYVNGVRVDITHSTTSPATPAGGTYIGNDQTGSHAFNGLIDDARFYHRALTPTEITKLAT